jgi:hypothetical protein
LLRLPPSKCDYQAGADLAAGNSGLLSRKWGIVVALTKTEPLLSLDEARVYLAGHKLIENPVPTRMLLY